jgi:hypothetical protein
MERRVVWVHGIGDHQAGYSDGWRAVYNVHLHLLEESYSEILWEPVFDAARRAVRGRARPAVALTRKEQIEAAEVQAALATILQARMAALATPTTRGATRARPRAVEWSSRTRRAQTRGIFDWILQPDEYLGDFAKYLVSKPLRTAVKEKAKERLRPFVGTTDRVSILAHSWGTVVAYDALLDLTVEQPALQVANLITLGSPLWLVRLLLEDSSGRKPGNTATWINISAQWDPVGSWLRPGFQVDHDYAVPTVGDDPHGSYFVADNELVQRDLIAPAVLG